MSNINANATVTLTVNGKQAQDMLDNLKKKSQDLEKAIENAAKAGNKQQLTRLQRELRQTNRQIAQIESATVGVEKVLRNLDKATPKELNKTLSTLKKQLNGIERGTTEWNRQCEAIKRVKHELERVNADLREGEGRWQRFNRIVNDWQATIMGAAAAVTGLIMAGRAAVKAYADMDAEMANVRKYTGMTADQVADLNEEFKKMDTRTSREDLNRLAEEAGRLGKTSKEDILGFVKAADQINVALDELGEGATLTLSKLTAIFGDEQRLGTEKALLAVGSVINELSQNCTAGAGYLANFAKRMAGVGAQAKMTIPEIMGFAAVLDSQGQAVEMSATAVSKLIMDMFKQQDKVIKATGINAEKFKETLKRSTNEGLIMLLDRLHELGSIDVLAPVFKDMGENGARAAQVISALAGNLDMLRWEQDEARKAFEEATSVTGEYNVQNNTVQAGLDKARKRVKELAVQLGEQLMPVMRHVISSTTLILKLMSTVINFFIKYKAEIISVTVVMGAYAIAVNLAAVKTKLAAAAMAVWNAVVKTANVLLPIAQVMLNGLKLAYERIIWQTRGANATQQAYNKSLIALKNNALAAKTAYGLLAVAIAVAVVALVRWIKSQQTEAQVMKNINNIRKEAAQRAAEEKVKIDALVAAAQNETLSLQERQRAIDKLNKTIPNYNAQLDKTSGKYRANKQALDDYIASLVRMYEVMGAKEKLKEIGSQKVDLQMQKAELEVQLKETKERNTQNAAQSSAHPQTTSGAMAAGSYHQSIQGAGEVQAIQRKLNSIDNKMTVLNKTEERVTKLWGKDIQKSEVSGEKESPEGEQPDAPTVPGVGDATSGKGGKNTGHEDKLKAEKEWKEKEEALNRIAYAKGEKNYEAYNARMMEIEEEYHKKVLDKQLYDDTLQLLELQHLKRMVSLTKEGTKERAQAEKAYQDRLIADQEKRQKEAEQKEKEHQQRLADLKKEYFGDNRQERMSKYMGDLEGLNELYNIELKTAGDNAKEKLRIEEAFQKAKRALRKKYGIDELDDNKNFLEEWTEDLQEWLQSDMGKAVTGALDVLSSGMGSIFQQLTALVQAETDIQCAAIEKRYQSEISNAEGNNYIVKKLEKQKEADVAKIKQEANKKMFAMQVIQAVAQTATAALNAYSSAAAVPVIGYILAPIAAASAIAAGMLQVAAIKKQQQASEAQGYAEGGFTPKGKKDEVAGVVHKGEWVASQELLQSPVARPMIEALDYAQRTNTIGSLRSEDVSRSIMPQAAAQPQVIYVTPSAGGDNAQSEIAATQSLMREYASVIRQLKERLDEPFVTVNTVSGDTGIKQAQDEYEKLMRNKTPKSRRK